MRINRKMLNHTIDQINTKLANDRVKYRLSVTTTVQLGDKQAWYEISYYDATCSVGPGSPHALMGFASDALTIRECYHTLRGVISMMLLVERGGAGNDS